MSRRDLVAAVSSVMLAAAIGVRLQRAAAPRPAADDAASAPPSGAVAAPGPPPSAAAMVLPSDRCARRCRRATRRLERRLRQSLRHRPDLGPLPEPWLAAATAGQRSCLQALVVRLGSELAWRYDECRVLRSPFEVADVDRWLSCGGAARREVAASFTGGLVTCGRVARRDCRLRCAASG